MLFALAYLGAALLGLLLSPTASPLLAVWPPAGLYIAALLLARGRHWLLLIGAAGVAELAFGALAAGIELRLGLQLWVVNTIVATTAALILPRLLGERFRLHELRPALAFAAIAVLGASLLAALLHAALLDGGEALPWRTSWLQVLSAHALGVMLTAPLLLADLRDEPMLPRRRVEALVLAVVLAGAVWLVFQEDGLPAVYVLPPLLWAGVRFGVWGGALAFAFATVAGLLLAGPLSSQMVVYDPLELARQLEPRFTLFGLTLLLVAVLFREQKQATRALRAANRALEQRVADRTEALARRERDTSERLGELESIYASAPIGLAVLDPELRFVRVNELMARMNGRPAWAHVGQRLEEVLPELAPVLVPQLRAVLDQGEGRSGVEISGVTPAQPGVVRSWIQHWLPLRDEGRIAGVSVVCEEVSQLRRIEQALRESELRFRLFAENLDAVLWMMDPAGGRFLYVSPAYERLWGRSAAALLNDPDEWLRVVHPEDRAGVQSGRSAAAREGRHDIEYRVLRPDGATRWVRDRGFRMATDAGQQYLSGIAEDVSDDVAAEADLADSEHRFRLAARAAQGMVYEYNVGTGHVYRSEGLRGLVGFGPEQVPPTGQWWTERVHPDDLPQVQAAFAEHLARRADTIDTEYRVRHRDGRYIDVWDRAYIDRDSRGTVRRLIGHTTDISERKRNAQALAANEERLRVAAEAVQGMVYEWNVGDDSVVRSDGLTLLLGWPPGEVPATGRWWRSQIEPSDDARVFADLQRAASRRAPRFEAEFRIRHRHGHLVYVLDRSRLYYDTDGRLSRTIGSAVDISERRRNEAIQATLDRAGQRLAAARDAAGIAQALVDALVPEHVSWCVVRVEPRAEAPQALARQAPEVAAAAMQPLLARWSDGAEGSSELLAHALAGQAVLLAPVDEAVLRAEAMPAQTWVAHAVPLPSRERCVGVLLVGLTECPQQRSARYDEPQRELVEELARRAGLALDNVDLLQSNERALAQLRLQDQRKNEFLSMLAHELRNPLTPIRNAAEVLGTLAQGKPQLGQLADVVRRQTYKMARLIDDLLDMARITHGKVKLERSHVAMREVLLQAAEATRDLFAARRQTLALDLPEQALWVLGDALRLEQILTNLLSNAARFGAEADRIEVRAATVDGEVEVSVRDHGVGIGAELLPQVFELFTQGERTPDRQQGGLGIGLSLVRSLVELHGGTVRAYSDGAGSGALFVVRLPAADAPAPAATPLRVAAEGKLRVLVAEDNIDAGDTLSMLLRRNGYPVMLARSGPEAVALAREFRPQAVLLDIGLPGLDGFMVAQRLRDMGETADALILAVSGYGDPDSRRRAHAAGIDGYFVKPLDFEAALKQLQERETAVQ